MKVEETKIIIADDHPVLLNGLYTELVDFGYDVLHKADNGAEALEKIVGLNPHIAILDLEMPRINGFEIIKKAREENVQTKFIAFTYHKERQYILQANTLNISGYILKDEPYLELNKAINAIRNGETYFSKTFTDVYENDIHPEIEKLNLLTPSERTILRLIALGKSSKEIAEDLTISVRTIQKHRTNIINKLSLSNDADPLGNWAQEYKEFILNL